MKTTMRMAWSALLGLGLAACGPVDGTESSLETEQQALDARCTSLGTGITNDACFHASNDAVFNVNVTASATRDIATAPNIGEQYMVYTISLPANAEGSVKFTATHTGAFAFYRTQDVAFTVVDSTTNTPVPAALSQPISGCDFVYASIHDLSAGKTYIVATGPAAGNKIRVMPLNLAEYAVIYYLDADGDTYGKNTDYIRTACTPPANYVRMRYDCDDSNASTHPGAPEVCGNNIDENCDGSTLC